MTGTLQWDGMRSEYAMLPVSGRVTATGAGQLGVAFSGHRSLVREHDGHRQRCATAPGVVYVTAGRPILWSEVVDPTEALEIYPDPAVIRQVAGDRAVDVRPAMAVADPVVFGVACRLRRAHAGGVIDGLEGGLLAVTLARHLVRRYSSAPVEHPGTGLLTPRTLRRVTDHLLDRMDAPPSLTELAAVAGLSPFHLARAFRATTGLPPHRFLTEHRLLRARDLLQTGAFPVADIARQVGFRNLGHFRRTFCRRFGVGPGELRGTARSDPLAAVGRRTMTP
jgi:AraC family transcriptional regulator